MSRKTHHQDSPIMRTEYVTDLAAGYGLSLCQPVETPNLLGFLRDGRPIITIERRPHETRWTVYPLGPMRSTGAASGYEPTLDDAIASAEAYLRHKLLSTPPADVRAIWGLHPAQIFERAAATQH